MGKLGLDFELIYNVMLANHCLDIGCLGSNCSLRVLFFFRVLVPLNFQGIQLAAEAHDFLRNCGQFRPGKSWQYPYRLLPWFTGS